MQFLRCCIVTAMLTQCPGALWAEDDAGDSAKPQTKYVLRYQFTPGQIIYWNVAHKAKIRTTAGGTTQTVETASDSVKVWRIVNVNAKGEITFVHSVASVHMRHKSSGREETIMKFPLPKGKQPPPGYQSVASSVGVPLTRFVMDAQGNILRRVELRKKTQQPTSGYEGPMTIPLPKDPVAVGAKWKNSHIVSAPRKDGTYKRVRLQQRFTLQSVRHDIAKIHVESVILTPIRDPNIKIHLVQSKTAGTVTFDLQRGLVLKQDLALDEEIIGAPIGDASSMHFEMQFVEKYLANPPKSALRQKTGKRSR